MKEMFTKKVIIVNAILIVVLIFLGYFASRRSLNAYIENKALQRRLLAWIDREYFMETGKNYYVGTYGCPPMINTVPWSTDVFLHKYEKEFDDDFRSHVEIIDPDAICDGKHLSDPANHVGLTWTELKAIGTAKGSWILIAMSPFEAKIVELIRTNDNGEQMDSLMIVIRTSIY
jgi:hypothetical protein